MGRVESVRSGGGWWGGEYFMKKNMEPCEKKNSIENLLDLLKIF